MLRLPARGLVILEAPAPITPAPEEFSNPDLSLCYAMHPRMKCVCEEWSFAADIIPKQMRLY